ncbi:DUF3592 domain-containing protein [Streptomyces sp. ET3-23]|uniref:DUF3592 domain-containing protein n=1 Tax=Streptomyces sp. ET3-23 TaxID=2885643 RepID=UPI001D10DC24|nr:DUF3592 domain-containing protein [Streptomyces sp. ET3-23]MCC2279677.1 DUF3592 domain-containing protein [Streptomyces sp. ET3-23]
MGGAIILLFIFGILLLPATVFCRSAFQLSRLRRSGMKTEGVCTHHQWGEGSVASIFEYSTPDGKVFTVSSEYWPVKVFEVSDTTEVVFDPKKPSRAAIITDLSSELRTSWIGALTMSALLLSLATGILIAK